MKTHMIKCRLGIREAKTKGEALEKIAIWANELYITSVEEEELQDYAAEVWG